MNEENEDVDFPIGLCPYCGNMPPYCDCDDDETREEQSERS